MKKEPITAEISNRICKHMNQDHIDALVSYAKNYGGFKEVDNARMIEINASSMSLEVDGEVLKLNFKNQLTCSEDAHKELVQTLKGIEK